MSPQSLCTATRTRTHIWRKYIWSNLTVLRQLQCYRQPHIAGWIVSRGQPLKITSQTDRNYFEGVCSNYRYPGPRRVITQGPSAGRWTISADAADAGVEFQIVQKHYKHRHSWFAPARCFFDFFRDVSHEMIGLGTFFGKGLIRNASKTYRFA